MPYLGITKPYTKISNGLASEAHHSCFIFLLFLQSHIPETW